MGERQLCQADAHPANLSAPSIGPPVHAGPVRVAAWKSPLLVSLLTFEIRDTMLRYRERENG